MDDRKEYSKFFLFWERGPGRTIAQLIEEISDNDFKHAINQLASWRSDEPTVSGIIHDMRDFKRVLDSFMTKLEEMDHNEFEVFDA